MSKERAKLEPSLNDQTCACGHSLGFHWTQQAFGLDASGCTYGDLQHPCLCDGYWSLEESWLG